MYFEDRDRTSVEFPVGGVMILGHNFDSKKGYDKSLKDGVEALDKGTWRGVRRLLTDAAIPINHCFFTNVFMGLCEGDDNKKYLAEDTQNFGRLASTS